MLESVTSNGIFYISPACTDMLDHVTHDGSIVESKIAK